MANLGWSHAWLMHRPAKAASMAGNREGERLKIACIGGGPAALYFAISMKLRDPRHDVHVFERNAEGVTFGWGVVFSDQTVENLHGQRSGLRPGHRRRIRPLGRYRRPYPRRSAYARRATASSASAASGCSRSWPSAPSELGVESITSTECDPDLAAWRDWDLVIAADGINSRFREAYAEHFGVDIAGTRQPIHLARHAKDVRRLHLRLRKDRGRLDLGARLSLRRRLLDVHRRMLATRPGPGSVSTRMEQAEAIAACEAIFAKYLDGAAAADQRRPPARLGGMAQVPPDHLRTVASRQADPARRRRAHRPFLDRIGHQAGARRCDQAGGGAQPARRSTAIEALAEYQAERSLEVLKLQNSARNSTEWFETVERYLDFEPWQFAYSLLTRSQRISHENLRLRDRGWLEETERAFWKRATGKSQGRPPMFAPFKLREMELRTASSSRRWRRIRRPTGARRFPSRPLWRPGAGRRGPGVHRDDLRFADGADHARLHRHVAPQHVAAWRRITDFVHANSGPRSASSSAIRAARGRPSSAGRAMDAPLEEGNWPLIAASRSALGARQPGAARR